MTGSEPFDPLRDVLPVPVGIPTPEEVVAELDRYVIGQGRAKRAIAVALRNRARRLAVGSGFRDEVTPRNILLIGPTGCGKTEIARRVARLVRAPFVKVEASRYTEVGYVGRDVETMIRDLVADAVKIVRAEAMSHRVDEAERAAEVRLLDLLLPTPPGRTPRPEAREALARQLREGALDDRTVAVDVPVPQGGVSIFGVPGQGGGNEGLQDILDRLTPRRTHRREMTVREARRHLCDQELEALVTDAEVADVAVHRAEQEGIVFIDEIDKVAGRGATQGPDVSREGVQRDILPIVEGATVQTRWGPVRTDHVLFVAAGAFHVSKPSDLIPELQGRFPVRVELDPLDRDALRRILVEPRNALVHQYAALLATEGVELTFTPGALDRVAAIAADVNERSENIGARRLQTVMERLLEDVSFGAPGWRGARIQVDEHMVEERLRDVVSDVDLSRFIL